MGCLPYIDGHTIRVAAPREQAWAGLERYVEATLRTTDRHPLARVLGTVPRSGFAIVERRPYERLTLAGRHRFARYELTFELDCARPGATYVHAETRAAFPGLHGRLYRAAVVGSGGHVIATRHLLRRIRTQATLSAGPAPPA